MGDTVVWGTLIALGGAAIAFATFWTTRGRAEASTEEKASAAMHVAKAALAKAEKVQTDQATMEVRFAREYASLDAIGILKTDMVKAIDRLGDRLDRLFEHPKGG